MISIYITFTSFFSIPVYLLYLYNFDRDLFYKIIWNILKFFSEIEYYNRNNIKRLKNLGNYCNKLIKNNDKETTLIMGINSKTYKNIKKLQYDINNKNIIYNLIIYKFYINNEEYYASYDNIENIFNNIDETNINDCLITSPFIQVEINVNNTTINISDKIKKFYLKDNIIFGKYFLKWFLKEFYNFDDFNYNDYKLNIIDNNINELKITNNRQIKLKPTSYEIVE